MEVWRYGGGMSLLRIEEELSYNYSLTNSCPNIAHGGGGISLLYIAAVLRRLHIEEELSYSYSLRNTCLTEK